MWSYFVKDFYTCSSNKHQNTESFIDEKKKGPFVPEESLVHEETTRQGVP